MRNFLLTIGLSFLTGTTGLGQQVEIDSGFPGGNIVVEKIDGNTVLVHPDLRDTQGNWFYWCFRVKNAAGKALTFKFTQQQPVGVRGAAVSTDGGMTWKWAGEKKVDPSSFTYTFGPDDREVYFSFGMTYTQRHLEAFLKKIDAGDRIKIEKLCETKKGRSVEKLRLGKLDGEPKYRVLITARHHCCEMMASDAMEGIIQSILADDEAGKWLRQNVEFMLIPFVDKDGVEDGDQGKNRKPRDHNRDYDNQSVHKETAALRELIPQWSGGKLAITMDLHCPHIRGGTNEYIYQVGGPDPERWAQQQKFGAILEKVQKGDLVYKASNDLAYGKSWNTGGNNSQGMSFGRWGATLPGVKLSTGFEIPYANASGKDVTQDSARALGRDIGAAIKAYLAGEQK